MKRKIWGRLVLVATVWCIAYLSIDLVRDAIAQSSTANYYRDHVTLCTTAMANATIAGDLVVPAGETCTLALVTVGNNVTVNKGATFTAASSDIGGNLRIRDGATAILVDVTVENDVQATAARYVVIGFSDIGGNLSITKTRGTGSQVGVADTGIDGNAQINENVTEFGTSLSRNVIDGNLECQKNVPAPTGGSNIVAGNKKNQCSGL